MFSALKVYFINLKYVCGLTYMCVCMHATYMHVHVDMRSVGSPGDQVILKPLAHRGQHMNEPLPLNLLWI